MIGVNVVAAETDREARRLFTSVQQMFIRLVRRVRGQLPPPVDSMEGLWEPHERDYVERSTQVSAVGSPETVRQSLINFINTTGADEIMATAHLYDHAARLYSFKLAAEVFADLQRA